MPPKVDECKVAEQAFKDGNAAKQAADHSTALSHYNTGLVTAKSVELRSALLVNRSITLSSLGQYEEALADGQECATIRPSWPRTHECQATALAALGRHQEADASTRLAAGLAKLKQDLKNDILKKEVKAIRQEIKALQAQRSQIPNSPSESSFPHVDPTPQAEAMSAPCVATPDAPEDSVQATDQPPRVGADPSPSAALPEQATVADPAPAEYDNPPQEAVPIENSTAQAINQEATNLIIEGNTLQQGQNYERALQCYAKALELSVEPEMLSAIYFNSSIAHSYMRHFERALADANECIRINPLWPRGFECRGTALEVRPFLENSHFRTSLAIAKHSAPLIPRILRRIVSSM